MPTLALALDTSTPVLSCALVSWGEDGLRVLATREAGPPQITSTLMPGFFDELLAEAGHHLDDVQVLVSGLGPGLFTGARVAVATMKAIAYARELPLLGAGSLEAMALTGARGTPLRTGDQLGAPPESGLLCPAIDARKGEVYFALYRFDAGELLTLEAPRAGSPKMLADLLVSLEEPVRLFGTGIRAAGNALPQGEQFSLRDTPLTPGAAEIAYFALSRTPAPAFDLAAVLALEPTYLRPPEAEVALRRREEAKRAGQ